MTPSQSSLAFFGIFNGEVMILQTEIKENRIYGGISTAGYSPPNSPLG